MTPVIKVVAAPIVTGNQDITSAELDGLTPKGALFIYSRGAIDGAVTANAGASFGAADASGSQWAFASVCEDNAGTSGTHSWSQAKTDKCVMAVYKDVTFITHSEAAFVSFITEGVRINWTTVEEPDGWLLTVVFFAGDDWECKVGNWASGTPPTSVALGWEPTAVLVGSSLRAFGAAAAAGNLYSFGANGWDSNGARGGLYGLRWCNTGTGQRLALSLGAHVASTPSGSKFTTFGYSNECTRTSTTMSIIETGVFAADGWGYMALKWSGRYARFGSMAITATTGDQAFTGFGLIPKFVLLIPNQFVSGTGLGSSSMGLVAVNANKAAGWGLQSVHDSSPTKENSIALEDSIQLLAKAGDGAIDDICTVSSLQPDGMTFNFTTASFSGTHSWAYMALGPITEDEDEEPAAGSIFAAIIH